MKTASLKVNRSLFGKRSLSLKWHLLLLTLGILLPFVIFAFIITYKSSDDERADAERRLLSNSRSLNDNLEREFAGSIRTLQALAASKSMDENNLKGFYEDAKRVNETQPSWQAIILISPDGRQLVNTGKQFGDELSAVEDKESFQKVITSRTPTVGNISSGVEKPLTFPLQVPVFRNQELRYVVSAIMTTDTLTNFVKSQVNRNNEWTRTVIDGNGHIAARTRNPEQFVGTRATDSFFKKTDQSSEGVFRDNSLEGKQVYFSFVRSKSTNWLTVVAVPSDLIDGPGYRSIWFIIASSIGLIIFSFIGAIIFSRRISREIAEAAAAARSVVKGQTFNIKKASSINEVNQLNDALEYSSNLLLEREREREKLLEQSESQRSAAETANKLKDEFLITVSHELKTPLNSILGWITLMRISKLNPEQIEHAQEIIERNAKSQAKLIEDLLDVSRIITGKFSLEVENVNIAEIVKNVIDSTRHAAESKELSLEFNTDENIQQVMGDPVRLQQVIWNLISNAVKFTPNGGKILVELKRTTTGIQLIVSDDGKGISTEFLPFVFERFRQADGSTKREHGGMGLGLAIVKQITELHGGNVKAESMGEGLGAKFIVTLPMKNQSDNFELDSEIIDFKPITSGQSIMNGAKILVIDDEPDARELIKSILSQKGAEIRTTASVSEAIQEIKIWRPTIILSDIGMPHEDGFDFIEQLKELEFIIGKKIPTIALTAYAHHEDREKILSAGFIKYISKPIDSNELLEIVTGLINNIVRQTS